ncbi:MAG: exonuclease SbcCD subunit D [Dehalococcoidia bacterium]
MASGDGPSLRLLHTADVHLDAYRRSDDSYWRERRRLIGQAFANTIDVGLAEGVHLAIIAGDFFDSNDPAPEAVGFAIEQLRRLPVPVVILPGNHDCYDGNSVYRRPEFARRERVHIITEARGQRLVFPKLDLALWGRADVGSANGLAPLAGLPRRGGERWYVAVAHGHVLLPGMRTYGSALIEPEEMGRCDVDYIALGHWEPFADVSGDGVVACYAGAPLPLTDGGEGRSGSVTIVHLEGGRGVRVVRRVVDPRR